jgi:hypothetical protein
MYPFCKTACESCLVEPHLLSVSYKPRSLLPLWPPLRVRNSYPQCNYISSETLRISLRIVCFGLHAYLPHSRTAAREPSTTLPSLLYL